MKEVIGFEVFKDYQIARKGIFRRFSNRFDDWLNAVMFQTAEKGIQVHTWESVGLLVDTHPRIGKIDIRTMDDRIISIPARLVADMQDVPPRN